MFLFGPSLAVRADPPPPARPTGLLFSKDRAFSIPFHRVENLDQLRITQIHLYVSSDRGRNWTAHSSVGPEAGSFAFQADSDGEYWFLVRTRDRDGKLYPPTLEGVAPGLKVAVDSVPPLARLSLLNPAGDQVGAKWEVSDEFLDLSSLRLEYRGRESPNWLPVSTEPKAQGEIAWHCGLAGPIEVRLRIRDQAGNETTKVATIAAPSGIPAVSQVAPSHASPAPNLAPPGAVPSPAPSAAPAPHTWGPAITEDAAGLKDFRPPPRPGLATVAPGPSAAMLPNPAPTPTPGFAGAPNMPLAPAAVPPPQAVPTNVEPVPRQAERPAKLNVRLVNSTRFEIHYQAEQLGKSGLGSVKLWYTLDGRNWNCYGEDEDHESPFLAEVGGEGTYGFTLVAQSGAGMGDDPPTAGDPPQLWVEVDLTPPSVQIFPPVPGQGPSAGQLSIHWTAQDANLGPRAIKLYYSETGEGNWKPIAEGLENTGRFQWRMPKEVPFKFHVRVEAKDRAGNIGHADTARPVFVDLSRPKLKITTVEPTRAAAESAE